MLINNLLPSKPIQIRNQNKNNEYFSKEANKTQSNSTNGLNISCQKTFYISNESNNDSNSQTDRSSCAYNNNINIKKIKVNITGKKRRIVSTNNENQKGLNNDYNMNNLQSLINHFLEENNLKKIEHIQLMVEKYL